MNSLIIFAGAGASRGVSQEKYPMAMDFKKRLPANTTGLQLYASLSAHLNRLRGENNVDVEHVLWELGKLIENLDLWTGDDTFCNHLVKSNQITSIANANHHGPQILSQFSVLRREAVNLRDKINERVYEFYSQVPTEEELNRSWVPLLKWGLGERFDTVDVVTTNYDLVIESAFDALGTCPIKNGFKGGLFPGIDIDLWRDEGQSGLLTKLHGSVDWKLGNGGTISSPVVRRGHPEFDGDHGRRLILYPGFKGVPSVEPFVSFHNYFRRRLMQVSHIIFVGFAFRDEYINELIRDGLAKEAKVAVVNPAEKIPNVSFLKGAKHLKAGFGISGKSTLLGSDGVPPFVIADLKKWIGS